MGLPEGDKRAAIVRELEDLILEHDPIARRRLRLGPQVAEELLALTEVYADRPRLVALLRQRAHFWDPSVAR